MKLILISSDNTNTDKFSTFLDNLKGCLYQSNDILHTYRENYFIPEIFLIQYNRIELFDILKTVNKEIGYIDCPFTVVIGNAFNFRDISTGFKYFSIYYLNDRFKKFPIGYDMNLKSVNIPLTNTPLNSFIY